MGDNSKTVILAALGELAINWNFAEIWIRTLVASYAGKEAAGEIFTLELGPVGLQNALDAIAKHSAIGNEAEYLQHCSKLYERIRGYRNYYVHGTVFTASYTDGRAPAAFTFGKSAKGEIKVYSARVEAQQIQEVAAQCETLGMYARQIYHHLHGNAQEGGAHPPLPSKPPLPPVLDKNLPYPQLPSSQPQASAG